MLVLFMLLAVLEFCSGAKITCLDRKGKSVDWFVVSKLPPFPKSEHEQAKEGYGQVYMDSNMKDWVLLDEQINEENHPIYYTLNQIYNRNPETTMHILYSDQPPPDGEGGESFGHSKGDMCFDKKTGFWLIHSVPKFPETDKYLYPDTGDTFGQTFLCVSLSSSYIETIGMQLRLNRPKIYDSYIPIESAKDYPNIMQALENSQGRIKDTICKETSSNIFKFKSLGGQEFVSFAKCKNFNKDLYDSLVAPELKSDLLVETWLGGSGKDIPSSCSITYKVENILSMKILDFDFKEAKSSWGQKVHSKWAVSSKSSGKTWICIGDINRQESQLDRGGGTLCTSTPDLWKNVYNAITEKEGCSGHATSGAGEL